MLLSSRWVWIAVSLATLAALAACRHRPPRPTEPAAEPIPSAQEPAAVEAPAEPAVAPLPRPQAQPPEPRREGELRVALWSQPGFKPPEIELLEASGFAAGPEPQTLVAGPDRAGFGYQKLSWRMIENGLELRRQIAERSIDVAELTPDLEAPPEGRIVTARDAYLVACGCQTTSLGSVDRSQLLAVLPAELARAAYGLPGAEQEAARNEPAPRWPHELWLPKDDETLLLIARRLQALAAMAGRTMSLRAVESAELDRRRLAGSAPACLLRWRRTQSDDAAAQAEAIRALAGPDPSGRGLGRSVVALLHLDARYWIAPGVAGASRTDFGVLDLSAARPRRAAESSP